MRPHHYQRRKELGLTERQREVLELISRGKTNPEIADALEITLDGAKAHVRTVLEKLNAQTREEAAARWKESRGSLLERVRFVIPGPLAGAVAGGAAALALAAVVLVAFSPWREDDPAAPDAAMSIPQPQPPQPLRVSFRLADATIEAAYRDEQAWRVEIVRTPGSEPEVVVYADGTRSALSPEVKLYWTESRSGQGLAEHPLNHLLPEKYTWSGTGGAGMQSAEYFAKECAVVGDETVAGRDAIRLACGSDPQEYEIWLDTSLGWVLKVHGPDPGEAERTGNATAGTTADATLFEVVSLELGPQFASDEFVFVPPSGYLDGTKYAPDASTQIALRKGELAGGWTGTTLGGTPFSFVPGEGPTLLWFTASWCDAACGQYEEFAAAAARAGDRVRFIAVFVDNDPGAVEAAMAPVGPGVYEVVLIPDANGHPWEPKSIPLLIALDGSGAVVEMLSGRDVSGQIESTAELVAR